ncbi:hypothetical protein B0H15DRAFT_811098, partial [Mycena belliarum]
MSWNVPIPSESLHRTLKRALAAARVAVEFDASNHDTNATVAAYQRCIALLDDVIRREPSEEETQWLKSVRTSYRDRTQYLLLCRSVPVTRQSTAMWDQPECIVKPRRFPGYKACRFTVERMKMLCGCTRPVML